MYDYQIIQSLLKLIFKHNYFITVAKEINQNMIYYLSYCFLFDASKTHTHNFQKKNYFQNYDRLFTSIHFRKFVFDQ